MENASIAVQLEAVKSLQSTIRKLENALSQSRAAPKKRSWKEELLH